MCLFMWMWMYVQEHVNIYACACQSLSSALEVFLKCSRPYSLRQDLSIESSAHSHRLISGCSEILLCDWIAGRLSHSPNIHVSSRDRTLVLRLVCKQSIPGAVSRAEACLCIQTQIFPFLKTHRDYTPVLSSLSTWANVINLIVQTQEDCTG